MANWYYYNGNQKMGPVSPAELKRMASVGEISRQTIIECDGKRVPAEKVQGLTFPQTTCKSIEDFEKEFSSEPAQVIKPEIVPVAQSFPNNQFPNQGFNQGYNQGYPQFNQAQGYSQNIQPQESSMFDSSQRAYSQRRKTPVFRSEVEIKRGVSPLGIVSLVMGIFACLFSWIPYIGLIAWPLGIIGIILAFIGIVICLCDRRKTSMSFPIAGAITCLVAMFIAFQVTTKTHEAVEKTVKETVERIDEDLSGGRNSAKNRSTDDNSGNDKASPRNKVVALQLQQDSKIDDVVQFSIDSMEFTDKVEPTDKSGFYSFFKAEEGKKYLVVRATFKNLMGEAKNFCDIPAEFVLNGKYKYSANIQIDRPSVFFQTIYCTAPLDTSKVLFMASVPDEVADGLKSGVLNFGFNNDLESGLWTGWEKMEHQYKVILK